jgi:hypothetical protein
MILLFPRLAASIYGKINRLSPVSAQCDGKKFCGRILCGKHAYGPGIRICPAVTAVIEADVRNRSACLFSVASSLYQRFLMKRRKRELALYAITAVTAHVARTLLESLYAYC